MAVKNQVYGTSTVAWTAYNLLAIKATPTLSDELFEEVKKIQLPLCDRELFDKALKVLVGDKKYIHGRNGYYWLKDQQRRMLSSRDRNDAEMNQETGEIEGGWEGWTVIDSKRGPLAITEVVQV